MYHPENTSTGHRKKVAVENAPKLFQEIRFEKPAAAPHLVSAADADAHVAATVTETFAAMLRSTMPGTHRLERQR